jgi:hypothetical protein
MTLGLPPPVLLGDERVLKALCFATQLRCGHMALWCSVRGLRYIPLNNADDRLGLLAFEVHHPQELARYGTASHRQIVECFDRRRYALFAAPDGLMALDGQTLQSLTSFSPLDQVASEILGGRFFLIARALER